MPLFSVIIPVYNSESTIEHCLMSIAQQSFKDYEVIVVDDGSIDASYERCIGIRDAVGFELLMVRQSNSGPLSARQTGYALAKGEYIIHVDSDDALFPYALERLAYVINEEHPDVVLFDYVAGTSIGDYRQHAKKQIAHTGSVNVERQEMLYTYCKGRGIYLWEKAIKRSLLFPPVDSSFYDLRYAEDNLQSCLVFNGADGMAYISEPLYWHLQTTSGLDGVFDCSRLNDRERVIQVIRGYVDAWDSEYPDIGLGVVYDTWGLRWLTHRAVSQSSDGELVASIAVSEEFANASKNQEAVHNLGLVDHSVLFLVKKNWRLALILINKLNRSSRSLRKHFLR